MMTVIVTSIQLQIYGRFYCIVEEGGIIGINLAKDMKK